MQCLIVIKGSVSLLFMGRSTTVGGDESRPRRDQQRSKINAKHSCLKLIFTTGLYGYPLTTEF